MTGTTTLRLPRSRGAFSGVLLILLGIWGAVIPMIGPYLHFAYSPDRAWTVTSGRVWLEFLPAAGAVIGGIIMLTSKMRPTAMTGATLAGISGAWFAFGSHLTRLLMHNPPVQGTPVGGSFARTIEQLGFFTGLGVVIICVAAGALGRLSVVSARDLRLAERLAERAETPATPATVPATVPAAAPTTVPAAAPEKTRVPVTTTSADSTATGLPKRRAPLATLTRITSGRKADAETSDTEVTRPKEQVGSGT
jgi:hypothetical protein